MTNQTEKGKEKYNLYLENENGNGINFNYYGRVPNVGERIIFDMTYTDFEELLVKSKLCSQDHNQVVSRSLNDMFNGKEYVVTNVKSALELKLKELNLVPFSVEAREE